VEYKYLNRERGANMPEVQSSVADPHRQKILEKIQSFCLMDDEFMSKVFEDNPAAVQLLLNIILERDDLEVMKATSQYSIKSLQGRSVRLDVFAVDKDGKQYNIEIQRESKGAVAKRARYNSSLLDANTILAGEDYEKLPETYIIFITESDVLQAGCPLYHVDRVVRETSGYFGDAAHIIYVNGQYRGDSEISRLMEDFHETRPEQMHYKILADKVRYLKGTEEGVSGMSGIVEQLCKESAEEARIKERTMFLKVIVDMKKHSGESFETVVNSVVESTGLSADTVTEAMKPLWFTSGQSC